MVTIVGEIRSITWKEVFPQVKRVIHKMTNCICEITRSTLLVDALNVPSIWSIKWKYLMERLEEEFKFKTHRKRRRGLIPKPFVSWPDIRPDLVDHDGWFTPSDLVPCHPREGGISEVEFELSPFTDISPFLVKPTFETFLGLYTVGMLVDFVVWNLRRLAEA